MNEDDEIEAYAWWRRNDATGEYFGLDAGLQVIADAITANGGIDAVIGFSQGGCFAAIVASLLDSCRPAAFKERQASGGIPYPESFAKLVENGQKPLKFCVSYAGFWAPPPQYGAFYEPKIQTPTLHVIGSLDTVVEEDRTQGLVDRTEKKEILVHPGGHFVPVGKEWVGALISYVRRMLEGEPAAEAKKVEESVEDMDMPF